MADFHIAIFAKAPIAGQVKTRLIPLLGAEGAASAYRQMLMHALQIARDASSGQVSLWVSGAIDDPFLTQCSARFAAPLRRQTDGDLGDRMATCLRTLLQLHKRVLLIGSDCPVLSVRDLQLADTALHDGARMVFTPAEDGGYVLVGMRRIDVSNTELDTADTGFHTFDDIAWSTADVMAQTRARLIAQGWRGGVEWAEMPTRWDVDVAADYLRAVREGRLHDKDNPAR